MALPFPKLIMRKVQQFDWMTPADYDVFYAIVQSTQLSRNTFRQSRVAMAAKAHHHKRTVQKSTRKMAEHDILAILETRIAPGYNDINRYILNERFFRTWLKSFSAAFQRDILHKRCGGGRLGHPQFLGGENSLREVLSPPGPREESEEKPTREPGGLAPRTAHGYDRGQAQKVLEALGCTPEFEHYEAMLAALMYTGAEENPGH